MKTGRVVYVYKPPPSKKSETYKLSGAVRYNSLKNTYLPYNVTNATEDTVLIDENGILNTVSIYQVAIEPQARDTTYNITEVTEA